MEEGSLTTDESSVRPRKRARRTPVARPNNTGINRCSTLTHDTFYFRQNHVSGLSAAFNTTLEIDPVDIEFESGSACASNAAEKGDGYRVDGSLSLVNDIVIDPANVGLSLVPGSGSIPYFVRVFVDVGDVPFASDGTMDISAYCTSFDQAVTGVIPDVSLTLDLAPPRPGNNHFSLHSTTLDTGDIEVGFGLTPQLRGALTAALSWLLPPCNLVPIPGNVACGVDATSGIEGLIVDYVNGLINEYVGEQITGFIDGALDGNPMVANAISGFDTYFWLLASGSAPRIRGKAIDDVSICETRFARYSTCNGSNCARYRLR